jgi:acetylornithine deacetylase
MTASPSLDPVELTRRLVAIPSVNPALQEGASGEAAMAEATADLLRDSGFAVEVQPVEGDRCNVVARLGDGRPTLLLNGHLDTVGTDGMSVDPWGGDSTPERVIGRGAADMKSGLAAILSAASIWARGPGPGTLIVALTCDEEHASVGMQRLVASGLQADAAVVTEPTSLALMPAHKGFAWVEVEFTGRAAHGSRPEVGVDAVRHAAAFLQELDSLEAGLQAGSPHPLLGHGSLHVGTIRGGTAWSVYPDRCRLTLERRTLPDEAPEGFLDEVRRILGRVAGRDGTLQASARLDLVRPGSDVPADQPLIQELRKVLSDHGLDNRPRGMTAWVDAAYLNGAGIPAICFGPGSIAQAHAADEWVSAGEIRTGTAVLADFVTRFLGGAVSGRAAPSQGAREGSDDTRDTGEDARETSQGAGDAS